MPLPKILVTAYTKNSHLIPDFKYLADKFLGLPYEIDIAPEGEKLSSQLIRLIKDIKEDYFVLIKEDFFFIEKVDLDLLQKCFEFAVRENADRFSLQCVDDGYQQTAEPYADGIFKLNQHEMYLCSLEASIWRTQFLKDHLWSGGSDRDIELNMGKSIKNLVRIFVPEKKVFNYRDALIGGGSRIKVIDGSFHIKYQTGTGEDGWKNLHIER